MAYALKVMVINRKTRKGVSSCKVKCYGGEEVKTDSSGIATVISKHPKTEIYVDGRKAFGGNCSNAPTPILFEKG